MEIGQKIKLLRLEKGLTQIELSKKSGVSEKSIRRYELNEANVTISILEKIAKALNVNKDYFMSISENVHKPSISQSISVHKSSPNHEVVNKVQLPNDEDTIIHIPRFTDKASAGNGITNYHSEHSLLSFTKRELQTHFGIHSTAHLSVMESTGDSMMPTIAEGSLLLVQEEFEVLEGRIYVIRLEGDLYVKRIQKRPKIKLISDNTNYDPIEIKESEELVVVGRVVGSVSIKRY